MSAKFLSVLSWPREPRPLVFLTTIEFSKDNKILFSPIEGEIKDTVNNTLDSIIALVNHVPRVIFNQHLAEYFREERRGAASTSVHAIPIGDSVRSTPVFQSVSTLSLRVIHRDFEKVTSAAISEYSSFLPVYEYVHTWDESAYNPETLSAYQLEKDFKRINKHEKEVKG